MKAKNLAAVCILLLFATWVSGESYKVKKLKTELLKTTQTVQKTDLLIRIANEIKGSDPDSALIYFKQAENLIPAIKSKNDKGLIQIKLLLGRTSVAVAKGDYIEARRLDSLALIMARRTKHPDLEAQALMSKGGIYYQQAQYDKSQDCNIQALKLIRTTSDRKTEGKILTNMGTIEFMFGNARKADSLFRIPLRLAQASNDEDLLAASLLNLGLLNFYNGKYTKAEGYFLKSAEIYHAIDGKDGLVLCYQNLSNIWFGQGNMEKAIEYNMLNFNLSNELGDKVGLSKALQNLGECNSQIGDYEKALEFFIKSLDIKNTLGDKKEIATTYSSIGHIHYMLGEFTLALEYYRKSLKEYERIGYAMGMAASNGDIGNILSEQKKTDSALFYFAKSAEFYKKNENISYLANVFLNMGKVYLAENDYNKAESYFSKALEYKTQVADNIGIYNSLSLISTMHKGKSQKLPPSSNQQKHELSMALAYAQKAWHLADSLGPLPGKPEMAGNLMDIYTLLGRPIEALRFAKIKLEVSDSLNKKQRAEALTNAEIRWKTKQKQREIDQLVKDRELQKKLLTQTIKSSTRLRILTGTLSLTALLLVFIFVMFHNNRKRKKEIDFQLHLNEITRLKMQNINNRLSPHFLFNLLGSVASEVSSPDVKAGERIRLITHLLRRSLESTEKNAIPLSEELEMVKSYLSLNDNQIEGGIEFNLYIDSNLHPDVMVPVMAIQIPAENALKHGLLPLDGYKKLTIRASEINSRILIEIEDNGIGRKHAKGRTTGTGTGLKSLLQTIHLLNRKNKEQISFSITDVAEGGTLVTLSIPTHFDYSV